MEFVLLPLAIVLLFYFILLKPMLDQQKKHRGNIAKLEIGDEVLTTGGFFAIVLDIETQEQGPPVIILEVAPGVELEGTPSAISEVNPRGRPEPDDDADEGSGDSDASGRGGTGDQNERVEAKLRGGTDARARIEAAE
ncbi:MAG: preprotein translocase subunit YajC [Chloroflexi bacterium]|nr:preprotein translocase subunit YajC [Chloroflexota bacterium]MDA1148216.1 preprotein translocase subunit YajC [Chloroflexota bacterium]MQC83217.1 preprotein translocase subunit YajC [Chloroflexota bacterium]